ncbi:hypothetical protein F4677DRAFT_26786 [Hypoxylon crocopeplum]|nr:hypothetical protein F4677DRAFT_26786 [Hypoxylon crocopeplum]
MDPFTPLAIVSLAGNIAQFVENTAKIIAAARELRNNYGEQEQHMEINIVTRNLQDWLRRITPPKILSQDTIPKLSEEDQAIRELGDVCAQIAQKLLDKINKLKVKHPESNLRHVETFYRALRAIYGAEELDELQVHLDRVSTQIHQHLTSYNIKKVLYQLGILASTNAQLEARRSQEIKDLMEEFRSMFEGMQGKLEEGHFSNRKTIALLTATEKGSQYSTEQVILEHLWFPGINDRYEIIADAHQNTFGWMFNIGEQRSPTAFDDWLSSNDTVYWIAGKPGSGKSTLMKFLQSQPHTVGRLRHWHEGRRLVIAKYFFWISGKSELQKSQVGLLRSLMYQILRQCPDMIAHAYPTTWKLLDYENNNMVLNSATRSFGPSDGIPLTVEGLLQALRTVCSLAESGGVAFCFFIDGLDEYKGKPADMIALIRSLRDLPSVKLCVSSRLWEEFEQELGKSNSRKMYMEEHNSEDIRSYVQTTFEQDANYQAMEDKDQHGDDLIQEIVEGANGVFLWVFLVVKSFQEGFMYGDSVFKLRERLNSIPRDLNQYFERILLSDITEFYRGQSAEMFLVSIQASEDLPLMAYYFVGQQGDPDFALKMETS